MTRSHYMLPGNDGGNRRVDQAMLPLHQKPILHAHRGSISLKKHCTGSSTPCTRRRPIGEPAPERMEYTLHEGLVRFSVAHPMITRTEESMIIRNESRSRNLWMKPSSRKDSTAALVHRAAVPCPQRGSCASEKGPTLLRVYVVPVLLLNLAFAGWDSVVAHAAHGWSIYLGYAVIVTVSLRLYLGYLDRYVHYSNSEPSIRSQREGNVPLHLTDESVELDQEPAFLALDPR
jgi:hypothetical protein